MTVALPYLLLCLLYTTACTAPIVLNNFQRIQGNPSNTSVVNVAIGAGMNLCSDRIVVLTNHSVYKVNTTFLVRNTSIISAIPYGGLSFHCATEMCAFINPRTTPRRVVMFNSTSGVNFRPGEVVDPQAVFSVQITPTQYQIYTIDNKFNSSLTVVTCYSSLVATGRQIRNFTNAVRITSLVMMLNGTSLALAYDGDTTLRLYSPVDGADMGTFGTFGSVGYISRDFYGRVFVYDRSCSCIKIHDPAGNWIYTVDSTTTINPRSIAHSRNNFFILDDTGILQFFETPVTMTSFSSKNVSCVAKGGQSSISVTGGSAPFLYHVFPEQNFQLSNSTYFSSAVSTLNPAIVPYYIYSDVLYPTFRDMNNGNGQRDLQASNSSDGTVTPYNGTAMCSMLFVNGASYGFTSDNFIDSALFGRIEFMLNVGNGGQNFSIAVDGLLKTEYYNNSIPLNQWVKITIDLSAGSKRYYSTIQFTDLTMVNATNSTIYLDNLALIPYATSTLHQITVTDFCGVSVQSPQFDVANSNPLTLTVASTPTSCYPSGINAQLERDGKLIAQVTGGTPPYQYVWSNFLQNATTQSVTGLSQTSNRVFIYDDQLSSVFSDSSFASDLTFADTTNARSGNASLSFTLTNDETISVSSTIGFNASKYSAIEFWINGGDEGQQLLTIGITRNTAILGNVSYLHNLLGLPSIPSNVWLKVSFPITPDVVLFTGFLISGVGNWRQHRLYIDDISIVSTALSVTVSDSSGCTLSTQEMEVYSPEIFSVSSSVTQLSCYQSGDGAVGLHVTGGTAPYSYTWSVASISDTSSVAGLPESELFVTIHDAKGCTLPQTTVDVLQPPPLSLEINIDNILCIGGFAGIVATANGGYPPYTYAWTTSSNATHSLTPKPLPTLVFSDSFKAGFDLQGPLVNQSVLCQGTGSFLSTDPDSLFPSHSGYCSLLAQPNPENLTLFSIGCPGCIDITKYSAMEFRILLDNPSDAQFMHIGLFTIGIPTLEARPLFNYTGNMTRGWKKVSVDFSRATQEISDTVNIKANQDNITFGKFLVDDVVLIPKTTLDTGASKYVSQGFKSAIVGTSGKYVLTVSDSKGCLVEKQFNITAPVGITADAIIHAPSASGKANGKIDVIASGGTPPYTYTWLDTPTPQNDSIAKMLSSGSYLVSITDANRCSINSTFTVSNPPKSQAPMIAGISAGVGIFVLGAAALTGFFVLNQRKAARTLKKVEEVERRNYNIDLNNLDLKNLIGTGSFGEVFAGEYKGTDVAVKKLNSQQMSKQQIEEFAKEAAVMVGLRHPNILLFMGVCLEPQRICIVTELMPRGNLSDVLRDKNNMIPIQIIFNMALDTLKGLQFIHTSGFIHRDLKSPNLLVDKNWKIKIADFGLSCAKHSSQDEAQVSLLWTAPEILKREENCYSYASDMYAFGVIMWELLSKKLPYEGVLPGAIMSMVVGGKRPEVPTVWDPISTSLITSAWEQDPAARPTVQHARQVIETDILNNLSDLEVSSATFTKKASGSFHNQVAPPQPPFAIVSTNVEGLNSLWEENPQATGKAIEDMVEIFHQLATKLGGYEITHDTPYLFGFSSAINALNFCLRTSTILRNHKWDPALLACSKAAEGKKGASVLYRGLRVHMAIHWGIASLRKDPNTGKVTYVGRALAIPPNMLSYGHGGAVVVCPDIYSKLMDSSATLGVDPYCIIPLGNLEIQSVHMNLYELVPAVVEALLHEERVEVLGFEVKESWIADISEITLGDVIGVGTYGSVYKAIYHNKTVAAKKFVVQKVTNKTLLEMKAECAVLRKLHHENIIQFEGMCIQTPIHYLLVEFMERGSLQQVLADSSNDLPWTLRMNFANDIAAGLAYLHKANIIHGDIKSTNLLLSSNWTIKIADIGFSRVNTANQTMTQCRTVAWTAPEILEGSHYSEKADVYSYAVVLWELIFRKKPWRGKHSMKIIQIMATGGRLPLDNIPRGTPQNLLDLIIHCWTQNPNSRPSCEQILTQLNKTVL